MPLLPRYSTFWHVVGTKLLKVTGGNESPEMG